MATIVSRHGAALGLPGPAAVLGGVELAPGSNQVDDAAWLAAKDNDAVKAWLSCGLILEETPPPAPAPMPVDQPEAEEVPTKKSKK